MDVKRAGLSWLSVPAVLLLSLFAVFVLNADPAAEYPLSDGGFFLAIIEQILAGHFAYPQSIAFNGLHVPFVYSPLSFYGVALLAGVARLPVPRAMNLWVIAWGAAIAPAAYYAARQFLRGRLAALVAAAFVVVFNPFDLAFLGMGGGVPRAPGFVFFMIACGAAQSALNTGKLRSAIVAGVAAALTVLAHMEYGFMYAASFAVLCLMRDAESTLSTHDRAKMAGYIVLVAVVVCAPWLVLVLAGNPAAALSALHTSQGGSLVDLLTGYLLRIASTWPGVLALAGVAWAFLNRRFLWLVWIVALLVFDSHAGPLAVRLPAALAVGWSFSVIWESVRGTSKQTAIALLAVLVFEPAVFAAHAVTSQFHRLNAADIMNFRLIRGRTEPDALVVQLYPGALNTSPMTNPSDDWIAVIAQRQMPLAIAGWEWIDYREFFARRNEQFELAGCVEIGSSCVVRFMRHTFPTARARYVYIPAHGDAYALVASEMFANCNLSPIFVRPAGALFRLRDRDGKCVGDGLNRR